MADHGYIAAVLDERPIDVIARIAITSRGTQLLADIKWALEEAGHNRGPYTHPFIAHLDEGITVARRGQTKGDPIIYDELVRALRLDWPLEHED